MRVLRTLAAACVAAVSFTPITAHATCGAEGCPLVRDGLDSSPRRFAFDLRYQDVTQDKLWNGTHEAELADVVGDGFAAGHGEVELFTRTHSWVAEGRVRITDDLRLSASLPYIQREHRHALAHTPVFNPAFVNTWKYEGIADATVLAHFRALHREGLPAITLQAGVKLPTGKAHVADEARDNFGYDSTLEPSARPGSGSTDWLVGGLLSQSLPWKAALPLTASVLARFNTKGTDDFEVGDEVQAGVSGGYAPSSRFTILGQVNYSGHGSDVSADAAEGAHSGMKSLYVTPGLSLRVSPALAVYGLYQARVWGDSEAPTIVATNHLLFGTTYSIGR